MISIEQLWLFSTLTFIVSASPGPVMLSCMADAGRFGFAKSIFTMLGASAGNLVLMLLSAVGLGLLVEQSEWVFNLIKWIGAAYLVYLGAEQIRAKPHNLQEDLPAVRSSHLFWKSLVVAITNPKGLIYFGALFPQFINIHQPMPAQFALLTVIFLITDLLWMAIYASGGSAIMRWLKSPAHQRWFNRISGGTLIAAGIALAFTQL
ncbi:LysE family translocator [Cellvibrio sp. KY-GH-1]|uniref:LysE family translocator n=1 Tax=Cellvibrio sp. KY-GH-1 TaxID=2303332 RepID=UPI001CD9FC28|nr:LysE family translocator [Cellvibrio sp. KY-GH-1]